VLRLEKTDGFTAAPFHPGQYVMIAPEDSSGDVPVPFLFCSSPAGAQQGYYLVAPAPAAQSTGSVPWKPGDILYAGPPQGDFYYSPLLDKRTVIGLTDASGVGAFLSMGLALRDGLDKFKLTVLYLESSAGELPFAEEFTALSGKVPLQLVPTEETDDPFNADFLRKHLPHEAYSVFICGGSRLHELADMALEGLRLPEKAIRIHPASSPGGQKAEMIR
jgi:ferredoxin-NADP reductase